MDALIRWKVESIGGQGGIFAFSMLHFAPHCSHQTERGPKAGKLLRPVCGGFAILDKR